MLHQICNDGCHFTSVVLLKLFDLFSGLLVNLNVSFLWSPHCDIVATLLKSLSLADFEVKGRLCKFQNKGP